MIFVTLRIFYQKLHVPWEHMSFPISRQLLESDSVCVCPDPATLTSSSLYSFVQDDCASWNVSNPLRSNCVRKLMRNTATMIALIERDVDRKLIWRPMVNKTRSKARQGGGRASSWCDVSPQRFAWLLGSGCTFQSFCQINPDKRNMGTWNI